MNISSAIVVLLATLCSTQAANLRANKPTQIQDAVESSSGIDRELYQQAFQCRTGQSGIMASLEGSNPSTPGPYGKCVPHILSNGTHHIHCDHSAQYIGTSADYDYDMTGGNPNFPMASPKSLALCQNASDTHEYCVQLHYTSSLVGGTHVNGCHTTKDGAYCGPCSTNCNNVGGGAVKVDVNCGGLVRSGHIFDGTLFNQIRTP